MQIERTVSATEARLHFGELMRQVVLTQRPVIVEKSGEPQVVVLSLAAYRRLAESRPADWEERVDRARARIAEELGGRRQPPAEQIIREIREERDAALDRSVGLH